MPTGDGTEVSSPGDPTPSDRIVRYLRERQSLLAVYLKGFAMGTAATVPGVSAGTVALIVGIYDRFIRALTGVLEPGMVRLATDLHTTTGRSRFRGALFERDVPFLFVLFVGVVTAVFTLARLLGAALAAAPGPTFAFFGGLIAASAFALGDRRWLTRRRNVAAAVAGFVIAFVVAGASGTGLLPETLPVVFVAAAVAISGMVLPGLSGSFVLLLLGQYEFLTGVVSRIGDHLVALLTGGAGPAGLVDDVVVVCVFVLGAGTGFLTTAHAVRAALDRYPVTTLAFLVSLMMGALRYPAIQVAATTTSDPLSVAVVALAAVAGVVLVLVLDRSTADIEYTAG